MNYNEILFIDNVDHNDFNEHPLALKNVNYINMKLCLTLMNVRVHANAFPFTKMNMFLTLMAISLACTNEFSFSVNEGQKV